MSFWGRVMISSVLGCAVVAPALADPSVAEPATSVTKPAVATTARSTPHHALYVDVLGKGGLWGLGYDYQLTHRFAVGAVASYYVLGGDQYLTFSPYVAAYPVRSGAHAWFAQIGPQVVHRATPSPVPEWNGMSTTSLSAELSTGYEYRRGILARIYVMGAVGDRFAPGLGVSLGWSW